MSRITAMLFDMADNTIRPPVLVEVNVSWPGYYGNYDHHDVTIPVDRDKWDAMTPAERTAHCEGLAAETARDMVGWGWHIYNTDDYAATEEQK